MQNINDHNATIHEDEEDRIHAQLKELVTAHELPPDTRLHITLLTHLLGACPEAATRNALTRLVEEGRIAYRPGKGFHTLKLSRSDICGFYEINDAVTDRALDLLQQDRTLIGDLALPAIFSFRNDSPPRPAISPDRMTRLTSDFFIHVASRTDDPDLIDVAVKTNDKLNYIRRCECTLIEFPVEEIAFLYQLYHMKTIHELRHAVKAYHVTRFKLIPRLMEIL